MNTLYKKENEMGYNYILICKDGTKRRSNLMYGSYKEAVITCLFTELGGIDYPAENILILDEKPENDEDLLCTVFEENYPHQEKYVVLKDKNYVHVQKTKNEAYDLKKRIFTFEEAVKAYRKQEAICKNCAYFTEDTVGDPERIVFQCRKSNKYNLRDLEDFCGEGLFLLESN